MPRKCAFGDLEGIRRQLRLEVGEERTAVYFLEFREFSVCNNLVPFLTLRDVDQSGTSKLLCQPS